MKWEKLLAKTPKTYAEGCLVVAVMQLSAKEEYKKFNESEILEQLLGISLSTTEMLNQKKNTTQMWILKKDLDRYPDTGYSLPDTITCVGTEEQSNFLAEYVSSYCPGCDDLFVVHPSGDSATALDEVLKGFKEKGYNVSIDKGSRVAAINEALSGMEESLGLYDFGGKNFVVLSPIDMDFNGDKHETYVLAFEK